MGLRSHKHLRLPLPRGPGTRAGRGGWRRVTTAGCKRRDGAHPSLLPKPVLDAQSQPGVIGVSGGGKEREDLCAPEVTDAMLSPRAGSWLLQPRAHPRRGSRLRVAQPSRLFRRRGTLRGPASPAGVQELRGSVKDSPSYLQGQSQKRAHRPF